MVAKKKTNRKTTTPAEETPKVEFESKELARCASDLEATLGLTEPMTKKGKDEVIIQEIKDVVKEYQEEAGDLPKSLEPETVLTLAKLGLITIKEAQKRIPKAQQKKASTPRKAKRTRAIVFREILVDHPDGITLTDMVAEMMERYGPLTKNGVDSENEATFQCGTAARYCVAFGVLKKEKGVFTLVNDNGVDFKE